MSAFGEHAALGRYVPTLDTDVKITRDEIYLLISGTHYMGNQNIILLLKKDVQVVSKFLKANSTESIDGTTFVARSMHFGTPSDEQKDAFTLVLKGFISAITSIFPPNASVCP